MTKTLTARTSHPPLTFYRRLELVAHATEKISLKIETREREYESMQRSNHLTTHQGDGCSTWGVTSQDKAGLEILQQLHVDYAAYASSRLLTPIASISLV